MTFREKLHPASFRGVGFLVRTESVTRGKKHVIHEYPNSDSRFVEELGKLPPTFTLEAVIHGEDALNKRYRLEKALEDPGKGKLVHPVYGDLDVMALNFSVTSSQTLIGEIRFSITFAESRVNMTPTPFIANKTSVGKITEDASLVLGDIFEGIYTPPSTPFNHTSIIDAAIVLWESVQGSINAISDLSSEGAATFNRVIRSAINNVATLVQSSEVLRPILDLILSSARNAAKSPEQLSPSWENIIIETELIPLGNTITVEQLQREQNKVALTEHLRLTALANSYEAKAYTDFLTDIELEGAKAYLDYQYKKQIYQCLERLAGSNIRSLTFGQDVRSTFAELRDTAMGYFAAKEKTTYRVVDIQPGMLSMPLAAYRYYGSIDEISLLTELNQDINHANFISGIQALAE